MGTETKGPLPGEIGSLRVHDHACLIFGSDDRPEQAVSRFFRAGLEAGDLCVYLTTLDVETASAYLAAHGLDVAGAVESGRLIIDSAWTQIDPESVRLRLEECLARLAHMGAANLRVAGEVILEGDSDAARRRLLLGEGVSGTFFAATNSIGLSLYNRDTLPPRVLYDIIQCHPILILGDTVVRNFYYVPPEELADPDSEKRELDRLLANLHERQSLEYRLRDQVRQTQLMVETSLDGIYRMAMDGTILEANDAFAAMVGYTREELVGLNMLTLVPQMSREVFQHRVEDVARKGSECFDRRLTRRDGTYCDVSVSATLLTIGGNSFFVCFSRDVTEHRATVAALRESERRYRQMLENARLLAGILDTEGRVTFCNDYFQQITGWTRNDIIGRNWFECIVPEEERSAAYSVFLQTMSGQGDLPFHSEGEIVTRDGERRSVVWTTCMLRGSDEEVLGAATIGVDITERKLAEAALRAGEERFRELAELLPEIVYEMDRSGKLVFLNRRALDMTGYTREDYERGFMAIEFIVEEQREEARRHIAEILAGKNYASHEYTVQTRDGRRFPVVARTSIIQSNGKPAGLRGILTDITDLKKAQEALLRGETQTRAMLTAIPDLIFLNDRDGVYLEFHSGGAETLLSPQEFLGHRMREVLPAELSPLFDAFDRTVATGEPEKIEYPLWFGGKLRYFEARIVPCHQDTYLSVVRDITDHRTAQEALVKARDFHLTLLEEFPALVWRSDAEGMWDYFNRTWLSFTGRTLEQEKGEGWADSLHPDDRSRSLRIHRAAFDARTPYEYEYRLRRCDGEYRWLTVFGRPFNDMDGNFAGYVGSCYDITDRKRAETERRTLESKIKDTQKLESLGVLAGGIAHDFNNLLTGILGHADLAQLEIPAESPAYESLHYIETAARRAAELTKQLLAYSGKGRFVVTSINLSQLIEEMGHLLDVSISKKCSVKFECDPDLPAIDADASQIRQVVMNLLINASEALGDQTGTITVRTGVEYCGRELLSSAYLDENLPEGMYVSLEVSDTGCGMSEATRVRIFEPFYTTKFTGRGLGLAAVLGIVRGHRGAIQVTSAPGEGCTFRVLFPASERQAPIGDLVRRPFPTWKGEGLVLVVDDEETVRILARKMLEKVGLTVITAEDGQEGIEVFEAHADEVRAVLLDVTMPRMDGREAFHRLQAMRPGVPVILSSGFNEQDATDHVEGVGLVGFVQKPYVMEELIQVLRHALEPR